MEHRTNYSNFTNQWSMKNDTSNCFLHLFLMFKSLLFFRNIITRKKKKKSYESLFKTSSTIDPLRISVMLNEDLLTKENKIIGIHN